MVISTSLFRMVQTHIAREIVTEIRAPKETTGRKAIERSCRTHDRNPFFKTGQTRERDINTI
jgi:hypothetical protein